MMEKLPSFALALKRRHHGHEQRSSLSNSWRSSDPESPDESSSFLQPNHSSPRKSPPRVADDEYSSPPGAPTPTPTASRPPSDELQRLRALNAELQLQLRGVEQRNREMAEEISDLRSERANSGNLRGSLSDAQHEISELTALVKSKDANISTLEFSYEKLEDEYRRLIDIHVADSEMLTARQLEIRRLQLEIEQMRTPRVDDTNRRCSPTMVEPSRTAYRLPDRDLKRFSSPAVRDQPPMIVEEEERPLEEVPLSQLNEMELRNRLEVLTKEKAEKERLLNHAAPRGAKLAQIKLRKQELEEEAIRIGSLVSKVRLEMRRRQIL